MEWKRKNKKISHHLPPQAVELVTAPAPAVDLAAMVVVAPGDLEAAMRIAQA